MSLVWLWWGAAGEFVSVSAQSDTERADLARETRELVSDPEHEKEGLAQIYAARGVEIGLARQVALQLMAANLGCWEFAARVVPGIVLSLAAAWAAAVSLG